MKTLHFVAATIFLIGCDDPARQKAPTGTPLGGGGSTYRPLKLHLQGAVFSDDEKLLLVGYGVEDAPHRSYKAQSLALWEVESGRNLWATDATENLQPVGFLSDNKTALVRGYNSLQVWDMVLGRRMSKFPQTPGVQIGHVALSHNGKFALVAEQIGSKGGGPTRLALWDTELRKPIRQLAEIPSFIESFTFSPDDRLALSTAPPTADEPANVCLWDIHTGKVVLSFPKEKYPGPLNGFLPDGRLAFCGVAGKSQGRQVAIWDVSTGQELRRLKIPQEIFKVFAPDTQHFLMFGHPKTKFEPASIVYISHAGGEVVWSRPAEVGMAVLSRDGKIALTGSGSFVFSGVGPAGLVGRGGVIKLNLWEVATGRMIRGFSDQN